jgi:hypothetical protein
MRRCECCGGPFGLVRHYHFNRHFCSKACKTAYLEDRAVSLDRLRMRQATSFGFYDWLLKAARGSRRVRPLIRSAPVRGRRASPSPHRKLARA